MSAVKEQMHEVAENLPESATFEEAMYALFVRSKIAEGQRQIAEGEYLGHEEAMKKLSKWLK